MSYINLYIDKEKTASIQTYITNDVYPIVLFENRNISSIIIELKTDSTDINKDNYIVTLYSNNFSINLDRSTYINNNIHAPEDITVHPLYTIINFHHGNFYKGIVRLTQKNNVVNKKIDLSSSELLTNFVDTDADNCSNLLQTCNRKIQQRETGLYLYKAMNKSCNNTVDACKNENIELKKAINSKNEENKKLNTSQSIQKTIIIVGVLIILVLLGLCIYLYFYKH